MTYLTPVYLLFLTNMMMFCSLGAQDFSNYEQLNYTIEDGLPSNECHKIIQDSLGYFWIATDRGLVRYDGYSFKTYGFKEGLQDISCLDIKFDTEENIWIRTYTNKIYLYSKSNRQFSLFEHQDIIDSYLWTTKILDFFVDHKGTIYLSVSHLGILSITKQGEYILDRYKSVEDNCLYFTRQIDDYLMLGMNRSGAAPDFERIASNHFELIHHNLERTDSYGNFFYKALSKNLKDSKSLIFVGDKGHYYSKDNFKTFPIRIQADEILELRNSHEGFLVACNRGKGLLHYESVESMLQDRGTCIIKDISATSVYEDSAGDIWVTTQSNGLLRLKKNLIIQLRGPSFGQYVGSIESTLDDVFYVVEKRSLFAKNRQHPIIIDSTQNFYALTFDHFKNELICSNTKSSILNREFETEYIFGDYLGTTVSIKSKNFFCLGEQEYLAVMPDCFILGNDLSKTQLNTSSISRNLYERILGAAMLSPDKYLLGTPKGLMQLENSHLSKLQSVPKVLNIRINEICQLDSWYVFATQGNGLVLWDLKENLRIANTSSGLASDNIEHVYISDQNEIYASTKAGLSIVSIERNNTLKVRNYTTFHGFPSNEINDVTQFHDTVYVATSKGVAIISGDIEFSPIHKVILEDLTVNEVLQDLTKDKHQLTHQENNLVVNYKSIDYALEGTINYRYRLNEGTWTHTKNTSAYFTSLPPGSYLFEVQSQNIDNLWSESATIDFKIAFPWWRTTGFHFFIVSIFSALIFMLFRRRTLAFNEQLRIETEIRDLERSALQAQMNPHFIFNCLNSIQGFIMNNEKTEAMEYLAKFAKLIRGNLNSSSFDRITLDQEVTMLDNYLSLERLRLNGAFEFDITTDPNLDLQKTQLPPMLVQPFVENAVLHGMQGLDHKGKILVNFRNERLDEISITVSDNGNGMKTDLGENKQQSLGMSITQKRLALINDTTGKAYKIEPMYSEAGTKVKIILNLT